MAVGESKKNEVAWVNFFVNRSKNRETSRHERQVDDVSDCGDKDRCTVLQKPSGDRMRIRLLARTVRQNLEDFRFRNRCERGEIRRFVGEEGERGDDVVGLLE